LLQLFTEIPLESVFDGELLCATKSLLSVWVINKFVVNRSFRP